MITLLKSGYKKIMQLFYEEKTIKLHLREIARQTKLHEPSTTRFLKNLEQDKILQFEKDGNLKKYYIKHTKRTYMLFENFDIEKFEKLPSIRKNAIQIYLDTLPEKPVFAILFGSTAKGTYKDESDIDMLIITNNKIIAKKAEKEANALTAMEISTFQMTHKNFLIELKMREDAVIQSALYSGYPLINHIRYYELLNK